ncbi:hypothetical protein CCP3SC15_870003 [Gammaproteobacteria bacterium]
MLNKTIRQEGTRRGLNFLGLPLVRFRHLGLRAKFSLLFYLVSLSSMGLVGWYGYQNASNAYRDKATELAQGYGAELVTQINDFLSLAYKDLKFTTNNYAMQRFMYWKDLGVIEKQAEYYSIITDTLRGFVDSYSYNAYIRVIDINGHEIIKIRHDLISDKVFVVPHNELEDVSDQSFFSQALSLPAGNVAISAFDLNRVSGRIEIPHVPLLRFSTPLVGGNKTRYGVVATSIRADTFYRFLRNANHNEQGRVFYLIDQTGNYLFHPDTERMFGHILGHGANFERDFPALLAKFKGHDRGVLETDGNIITYQIIYPNVNERGQYWLLVGMVPEAIAMVELNSFKYTFVGLLVLVILVVLVVIRYFLSSLMAPLLFVTNQLQRLGRGEIQVETFGYPAQDEIRSMVDSTHVLMVGMERLALQADAVGRGDFTSQAELLSEQDRLGTALNNMICLLRTAQNESERRNWLRDGVSQLTQALTGDLSSQQLADTSIGILGRYLGAGRGVFYKYDTVQETLELLGSYMYTERAWVGDRFKLGEGAIGQVAREKKPIILTTAMPDTPPIVTGTSYAMPSYTHTWPLLRDGELLGVLELAGFERFDELKQEFLHGACEIIASFLFVVEQRDRIKKLLSVSEASEQEAREQSRLLQETNLQMEEQQQLLQQQAQELQQTNSQMEEQQQQLQQQTEELQQTNAQLEEQQRLIEDRNRALIQSQQEVEAKARQLEQSGRYKSEFLANMSHELRTPLNSIILLSKMMAANEEARLDEETVKRAAVIHRSGQDLLRLINDVLDLSKVEAGRMVLDLTRITSSALVAEFRELFEQIAQERGLGFKLEDWLRGEFTSDQGKLSQIVRNLLSNAFKFTKQGGVTLRMERRNDSHWPIRIAVQDTGIGIPEDKQQLVFEAFQQVDGSTSREYGGTGLGLTISQRFAQLLGGTIELRSTPGLGSEFALLLPETLTPSVESAPSFVPLSKPPASSTALPNPVTVEDDRTNLRTEDRVILLIDDDFLFGQAVIEINHTLGYKTLQALTGSEGLKLAERYHPNGILLDLGLPDMDGVQVLHQIKTRPELAATPVYVISGRDRNAALMRQGIVGYLQKPVDNRQIAQAEAEVLSIKPSGNAILVVENGGITAEDVERIIGTHAGPVYKTVPGEALAAMLHQQAWRLVIIDLDARPLEEGLKIAQTIRAMNADIDLVFFGEHPLSDDEESRLRQYSDSIILKAPMAERRLLENIERFLKEVPHAQPAARVNAKTGIKRLMDRNILVVDDDARNLFVITAALEQQGAKVSNAVNGRRALDFLEKNTVDLIIMDIMMPEMDGYQTIAQIRANPVLTHIPVVALTAKALPSDREKTLTSGADDYLSKPVDYDVLINMAAIWCGQCSKIKNQP